MLCFLACPGYGLTITSVLPAGYQTAALTTGTLYHSDAGFTVTSVPLALAGGTLIRTIASDGFNPDLDVQFNVSSRAEVYVCCDPRSPPPGWLSSWLDTGMTVAVSDPSVGHMRVFARRFSAGTVSLAANNAAIMYFVVVKESIPLLPRKGWVLLSYDMPYLREIISHAPEYDVNHIQLSHDIMMYTHEVANDPDRRDAINELIALAHAYGVPEVTLWTHEMMTVDMPGAFFAADGRSNGDDPRLWEWLRDRYVSLFTAGSGCPEADGVVLTFDELSMFNVGDEVYNRRLFKHDTATPAGSVARVINTVQQVCAAYGKTCYARTWAGEYQATIRDGIVQNGDPEVWMMTKNVGVADPGMVDWQEMDTHHPLIGTLPSGYHEMIEFDLCGEYLGRGAYTFAMTSYIKDHWNYARSRGADDGAAARIDRQGSLPFYTANRLNLYAFKEVLANPDADPAAVNLAWCRRYFPADAAQDIADHYDASGSAWQGDTRYMTWEAFYPNLSPVTNTQAQGIALAALAKLDRHRAQLERQATLDTRGGRSDDQTLRNGIALALLDLGGSLPTSYGFSELEPARTSQSNPTCSIKIRMAPPGLDISSASCEYSTDGSAHWESWPATASGFDYSTETETITAASVPFNQLSPDRNLIRFSARDMGGTLQESGSLSVIGVAVPSWANFSPTSTLDVTPDCSVAVSSNGQNLDPGAARYVYSVDGGSTWVTRQVNWSNRYECEELPGAAGWTLFEGRLGYESLLNNGVLRISDPGTNWGDKVKYGKSWQVSPIIGATVLARMRCSSGGHAFAANILVGDLLHSESLYLKANGVIGLSQSNLLAPLDTTEWHTYRVTIQREDIHVYVDENPRAILSGKGAFVQGAPEQRLGIGSGASQYTQDILYDYVYWTTEGAIAPGAWWSASFTGGTAGGTITAGAVPFNSLTSQNMIRFSVADTAGHAYESPVYAVTTISIRGDFDHDSDVDQEDFGHLQICFSGDGFQCSPGCQDVDSDGDHDVDQTDFQRFAECMRGPNKPTGC